MFAGVFIVFLISKAVLYTVIVAAFAGTFLIMYKNNLMESGTVEFESNNIRTNIDVGEKITIISKDRKKYHSCIIAPDNKKHFIGYDIGGDFQRAL